jgi:hypothetical protein
VNQAKFYYKSPQFSGGRIGDEWKEGLEPPPLGFFPPRAPLHLQPQKGPSPSRSNSDQQQIEIETKPWVNITTGEELMPSVEYGRLKLL